MPEYTIEQYTNLLGNILKTCEKYSIIFDSDREFSFRFLTLWTAPDENIKLYVVKDEKDKTFTYDAYSGYYPDLKNLNLDDRVKFIAKELQGLNVDVGVVVSSFKDALGKLLKEHFFEYFIKKELDGLERELVN